MSWANCGTDSKGRPIGYSHKATCDHPGCKAKIDRGLSYACGGMHGVEEDYMCEKYFCAEHRHSIGFKEKDEKEYTFASLCQSCVDELRKIENLVFDDDEEIELESE